MPNTQEEEVAMALLQIRVDNALACQAREVARGMGLDLSSAVGLFLRQMVAENGLPFRDEITKRRLARG